MSCGASLSMVHDGEAGVHGHLSTANFAFAVCAATRRPASSTWALNTSTSMSRCIMKWRLLTLRITLCLSVEHAG